MYRWQPCKRKVASSNPCQIRISLFISFTMQFYKFDVNSSPLLDYNLLSASSCNFYLLYVSSKTYLFNIYCSICLGVIGTCTLLFSTPKLLLLYFCQTARIQVLFSFSCCKKIAILLTWKLNIPNLINWHSPK